MTTAAIIQARWGSTRLPGKVLNELGGASVLAHVLARCAAIPMVDVVCCAVADDPDSDPVAAEANLCGAIVTRGSQTDVLARYHAAAQNVDADIILRVTSDCPLIDPTICNAVLALQQSDDLDYACNNMPPSWPHGLDCEVFTRDLLDRAAVQATTKHEREHVTPWMRTNPDIRTGNFPGPGGDVTRQRWTLDYPEDHTFMTRVFDKIPPFPAIAPYAQLQSLLDTHEDISILNNNRIDEARLAAADQPRQETGA